MGICEQPSLALNVDLHPAGRARGARRRRRAFEYRGLRPAKCGARGGGCRERGRALGAQTGRGRRGGEMLGRELSSLRGGGRHPSPSPPPLAALAALAPARAAPPQPLAPALAPRSAARPGAGAKSPLPRKRANAPVNAHRPSSNPGLHAPSLGGMGNCHFSVRTHWHCRSIRFVLTSILHFRFERALRVCVFFFFLKK